MNNVPYNGNLHLSYAIRGAANLAPASSRRPPRNPITVSMLRALAIYLSRSCHFYIACLAAATTAFWSQCRLGELLSDKESSHDPSKFPSISDLSPDITTHGSRKLHLPWSKTTRSLGADVFICRQSDISDPISALLAHLASNAIPPDYPLFSYKNSRGHIALTKRKFLSRCNDIWRHLQFPTASGHCFRIGGTTELLIRGVSPEVIRVLGRWSSDSFYRYWRSPEVLAPLHTELLD
jgi:hypothetical protein